MGLWAIERVVARYKWSDEGFRKESLFREAEKGQYRNRKESKITMMMYV